MKRKYFKTLAICTVAALLAGSMPAPVYAAEEGLVQVTEVSTSQEEIVQATEESAPQEETVQAAEENTPQEETVQAAEESSPQEESTDQDEEPGLLSETDVVYVEALMEVETSLTGEEDKLEAAVYSTGGTYRPYEGAAYSLSYTVVGDGITITGITDYESKESGLGKLVIPEVIDGIPVTSIGEEAFSGSSGFTGELVLPANVTSIGWRAFYDCSGFTGELVIPAGVTSIGGSAFYDCNGFTGELVIPAGVTSIEDYAFSYCDGFIGELVIPAGVTSIGEGAFYRCSGFTGDLVIPEEVTSIGRGAFHVCSGFTGELTLPKNLTSIADYAFSWCGFTGELVIPAGVKRIGDTAFSECSGFTGELVIPEGVTSIGGYAFNGCSGFTGELVIPAGVTSIGECAFADCNGFTGELVIPAGVTSIGMGAFSYCSGFTGELVIPAGVTSIGAWAFTSCNGFTGDLVIPAEVTSIGECAFGGCTSLKSATFLVSDSVLGEGVFAADTWDYGEGCTLSRIYGYPDSTAQAYAEQMNIPFIPLSEVTDVENSVKVDSTVAGVSVSVPMSEMDKRQLLSEVIANAGQSGTNQEVSLDIQVKATNLSDAERERTQACARAEGYTVAQALDITMILSVGGVTSKVEQLIKPVRFVIEIPESMQNEERKYAVIRLHNGEAEILPDLDSDPATITIETDRFSSYTLAYKSTKGVSLSGAVESFGDEAEEVTVKVLNGDKVVVAETISAAETGAYQFEQLEAGEYTLVFSKADHVDREYSIMVAEENVVQDATIYLLGDVDGNGKINARDKKTIYNHIAGESELTDYDFRVGDVNGDGKINARDKKMIYNHIAGESLLW